MVSAQEKEVMNLIDVESDVTIILIKDVKRGPRSIVGQILFPIFVEVLKCNNMVLYISIAEAVGLIEHKSGKTFRMEVVNKNTIAVGYDVNVKIPFIGVKSKTISIDFIIDKVVDTDLYFHYSTGIMGGDTVINALLSFIPTVNKSEMVDKLKDGSMILHLNKIKQMENFLDKIKIDRISFNQDSIMFEFTPKT